MIMDDNDGQMIFGDLGGLKLPDICLRGEDKPCENLTQETCPDRGSNPGPLRDRRACYRLSHRLGMGMLSSCICVCVCNEKYSHRATGSVRKALDILPHSSKLRYVLPW